MRPTIIPQNKDSGKEESWLTPHVSEVSLQGGLEQVTPYSPTSGSGKKGKPFSSLAAL